jgi:hypothetical protein
VRCAPLSSVVYPPAPAEHDGDAEPQLRVDRRQAALAGSLLAPRAPQVER